MRAPGICSHSVAHRLRGQVTRPAEVMLLIAGLAVAPSGAAAILSDSLATNDGLAIHRQSRSDTCIHLDLNRSGLSTVVVSRGSNVAPAVPTACRSHLPRPPRHEEDSASSPRLFVFTGNHILGWNELVSD
jgi:hypothetical protein